MSGLGAGAGGGGLPLPQAALVENTTASTSATKVNAPDSRNAPVSRVDTDNFASCLMISPHFLVRTLVVRRLSVSFVVLSRRAAGNPPGDVELCAQYRAIAIQFAFRRHRYGYDAFVSARCGPPAVVMLPQVVSPYRRQNGFVYASAFEVSLTALPVPSARIL